MPNVVSNKSNNPKSLLVDGSPHVFNDHDTAAINVLLQLPPEDDGLLLHILLHLGQVLILLLQLCHLIIKLGNSFYFSLSKIYPSQF